MSEQNNEIECDLSEVPIRALSMCSRHQLSQYLNAEQLITTSDGLSRDYRGLAQLMGFTYAVVNNILRTNDPFNSLLQMFQNRSEANVKYLLEMIEKIGRFDVIDDLTPMLLTDAKHYLMNRKSNQICGKINPYFDDIFKSLKNPKKFSKN